MADIFDMADTWNSGGTTFTAIKMTVTDTASAAASLLMDLKVGATSKFTVDKAGILLNSGGGAFGPRAANVWSIYNSSTAFPCIDLRETGILMGANNELRFNSANFLTSGAADSGLMRVAAGIIAPTDGAGAGTGVIEQTERTAPAAGAANTVRIYAVDNGSGKTQLMALFSSGAAQQLAIQP